MFSSLRPAWTVARQAPLSMGFSRRECWSGLPCPPPGDLPDPRPLPLLSLATAGGVFAPEAPETPCYTWQCTDVSATLSVQRTLSFPCRAHKSIRHLHSCGHSFPTLTQKREQLPSPSQGISATPILSVKGDRSAGSQVTAVSPSE